MADPSDWIYECKYKHRQCSCKERYVQKFVDPKSLWGVTSPPHNDKLFRLFYGEYGSQLWSFAYSLSILMVRAADAKCSKMVEM